MFWPLPPLLLELELLPPLVAASLALLELVTLLELELVLLDDEDDGDVDEDEVVPPDDDEHPVATKAMAKAAAGTSANLLRIDVLHWTGWGVMQTPGRS